MGIQYSHRTDQDLTVVMWHGAVSLDQWIAHIQVLVSDPEFMSTHSTITDLRLASPDTSVDEAGMRKVVDFLQAHRATLANRRMAVVATDEFRRSRTFERLASSLNAIIIVFTDLATACTWIGVAPDEVARELERLQLRFARPV